jgi:hypothetical protein
MELQALVNELEALKGRVAELEAAASGTNEPWADLNFEDIVQRSSPRALELWFRRSDLQMLGRALYLTPGKTLTAARRGLSTQQWSDLVSLWKDGPGGSSVRDSRRELLRFFAQELEMGQIGELPSQGWDVIEPTPGSSITFSPQYRAQAKAEAENRKAEVEAWLKREVPELVRA